MTNQRLTRRTLLAGSGTAALGAVAGCLTPTDPRTLDSLASAGDSEPVGDDVTFTELYEKVIDSVTLVRVFGFEGLGSEGDEQQGQGSGFLYDDTYVVTNNHVVAPADHVDLQYTTGEWTETTTVGTDVRSDLAVLEVDDVPDSVSPLSLTDETPEIGQRVLAVGNPLGLEGSASRGIVSGVDRSVFSPLTGVSIPHAVQTDAALNPGNSGGPLVDLSGDVVGVISAGGGQNVGFAISAALANRVLPALVTDGAFQHAFVGTSHVSVDPLVAEENGLDEPTGVLITEIVEDGPAEGVLRASDERVEARGESIPVGGDVVHAIDGEPIPDEESLSTWLSLEASPGDTVELEIVRDGSRETVDLTLGERPAPS